ncbi:hypothetical protein BDV34DRAFT_144656 [Aspergillus parasiticus]|uniref:Uncharacterized protein n=1 Tax=Aspergillus parasiticus TaxID=5067 RepID=A0A5N6DC77_ASPPA|nr:hypothetical protein BDV34DRAFT_144656 [Aspergillus parasiticus]
MVAVVSDIDAGHFLEPHPPFYDFLFLPLPSLFFFTFLFFSSLSILFINCFYYPPTQASSWWFLLLA